MRKLVEWTFVSLDGVIESPAWARPFLDDEHHRFARALLDEADALLLGRKTYQGFSDFWPKQTGEIADRMNSRPKYVASRTLSPGPADWNATILEGDAAEAVARLKAEPGGTIVKFGTGELDSTLLEHGLVDEYFFSKAPVVVGRGDRLFEGVEATFELRETTAFASGVVVLRCGLKTAQAPPQA
jgi:dihydrofolate reductase